MRCQSTAVYVMYVMISGKPSQNIVPALLWPNKTFVEAFILVLIDCVRTVPKTKTDHSYFMVIMCTFARFPKAIYLMHIKMSAIMKGIVNAMFSYQ